MSDKLPINPNPYALPIPKGGTPAHLCPDIEEHAALNESLSKELYRRVKAQAALDGSPTIPYQEPAAKGEPPCWMR